MSLQSERALPQLADTPFLEKPPLTYWMSAAGISLFGDSPAAARAPNLLYALATALSIGALASAMGLELLTAVFAALVAASALLCFRVQSWLAPDACLLAGNALALLGLWRGYSAPPGRAKAIGYALMHAGAAVGFMAKSAPGWLVPGLTLLTLVLWERRLRELCRWELYAGLLLQALIIVPWLLAVAHTTEGAAALRTLFWNNLVGRFTHVAAPAALDYTTGHKNRPGKYLIDGFERVGVHREAVIVTRDLHLLRQLIADRMVGAAMSELQLVRFRAAGQAEQLVSETDAEDRLAAEELTNVLYLCGERLGVAGAVAEEDAVGIEGEHVVSGGEGGHDGHAAA